MSYRGPLLLGLTCILLTYLHNKLVYLPPHMNGESSTQFRPLMHVYKEFIQSGADIGSAFSVFVDERNVLDVVGGYTDTRYLQPWTKESVTQMFTLSLLAIPLTFAALADRQLINLTDPITKYLPKFSVQNLTVMELLSHQSGFPYFLDKVSFTSWREDYHSLLTAVSNQVPPCEPKKSVFHLHSLALLADGIVRRVDPRQRTLGHFFMDEIAWPAGLDIIIGIPRSQLYRTARIYYGDSFKFMTALLHFDFKYPWINMWTNKRMPLGVSRDRTFDFFSDYDMLLNRSPDFLEAPLASLHMFTNARGLARLLLKLLPVQNTNSTEPPSALSFSSTSLDWLLQRQLNGGSAYYDPVLLRYIELTDSGLMVSVSPEGNPIFGMWDDLMGQMAFVDPHRRLTVAYTTNHAHSRSVNNDPILSSLISNLYTCLTQPD